jgi:CHAD domain-containing protein
MPLRHPTRLVQRQVEDLSLLFPRLRDGGVEDVHRARVSTRRLRAALPLIAGAQRLENAARVLKEIRRALGEVRELDVMREVLTAAENGVPAGAAAAAVARQSLAVEQERARRQLIKTLEGTRAERALRTSLRSPRPLVRMFHAVGGARQWQETLRGRIHDRAEDAATSLQHASGVYFPNRLHRLRIAVKKLRYDVETADALGLWRPRRVLQDLKRVQARLGEIHDWQVVFERLDDLVTDETLAAARGALTDGIRAILRSKFSEYVERRDRLERAVADCRRFARQSRSTFGVGTQRLAVASVLLVPVALAATTYRRRAEGAAAASEETPFGSKLAPAPV